MKKIIYALGFFDGVHLGHQALLKACQHLAEELDLQSGAVTFLGHPQQQLTHTRVGLINTNAVREELLLSYVHNVLFLPFDDHLKAMPWEDFCGMLIKKHNAAGFVCGSDFRFGKGGEGTAESIVSFCESRGLPYRIVPQQMLSGVRISSTHIRTLLKQGKIQEANRFLGHPYILSGTVVNGKQLGRTIGVPTANLPYPQELAHLPYGVYACLASVDGHSYPALLNIGTRPTVSGEGVTAEAHLLDFSGDLYGKYLEISFLEFLRPEHKFPDLSCLQKQIGKDKEILQNIVQKYTLHP